MNIRIVAIGCLKEQFWIQAADEYLKRLRPYAAVSVVEIRDQDPASCGGPQKELELEGVDVLKTLRDDEYVILLDIAGKQLSSEGFAETIEQLAIDGRSNIAFVVGGSVGVSAEVRARANARLSFGKQTLPHNLARIVLLEQIYRAFKIIKREPYHK